jgi:Virulence factor BrkB
LGYVEIPGSNSLFHVGRLCALSHDVCDGGVAFIHAHRIYNATYGAVGGIIVMLLWFYISGIALIVGAELNATIEHASPYGKVPGRKSPAGKRLLGARAARAFQQHPALDSHEPEVIHLLAPSPSYSCSA